ncbi:hypothetical protein BDA96_10G175000 [Sorghum bicolor]|uniref:R13L1/DRL21-like LRR repeat region domain-containing protein n=1 Tax=Sorghum bicolor TaxID=4558 RepID=A0A921U124_SORBI|nr:hypothetical protein BDA96_10G175000 [Sorghum bicolor]
MKYMTALRHLYTHGCDMLKSMPPDLGHLTSLQTLTCFVAATGSSCSNMGELEKLDLGGQLELRRLENATGADARAASLWDKKSLEELTLRWSDGHDKDADKEGMVELALEDCQNLEKLPALWQLPSLQFLYLSDLQNLYCLFSGGAPSKFQKLKRMALNKMPKFETWWDTNEVQGEDPLFPEVEYLRIRDCGSLTALPKASVVVKQSSGEDDTECRSTFPALREMELYNLKKFHRWEAVEVEGTTLGEQVTFPQLEKLVIWNDSGLTTFPEAPKLSTLDLPDCCSEEASLQAASRYITSLSSLKLKASDNSIEVVVRDHESPSHLGDLELSSLLARKSVPVPGTLEIKRCDKLTGLTEDEASDEQSAPERSGTFLPRLESLVIEGCYSLVQLPNLSAPLKTLHISDCSSLKFIAFGQQHQEAAAVSGAGVVQRAAGSSSKEDESTVSTAKLSSSSASSNHCFFPCLEYLEIYTCCGLTEVASLSPSIKTLKISGCGSLVSLPGEEAPSLEELIIRRCASLESLLNGPHQVYSSLRVLCIEKCPRIKHLPPSLHLQQHQNHLDEKDLEHHLQGNNL